MAIPIIQANDAETPAVTHDFKPVGGRPGSILYEDVSGGVYEGFPKLELSLARPQSPGKVVLQKGQPRPTRNLIARYRMELPVMEASSGPDEDGFSRVPRVAYRLTASIEVKLPTQCTLQDRKNLRTLVFTSFVDATVLGLFEGLVLPQ